MIQERPGADSASALIPEPASVLSRRSFVTLATSMAFVLGFRVPLPSTSKAADRSSYAPNAFIRIDLQGDVTLIIPQVEMGQGVYTSLSMLLAEELDADWSRVRVEHAPADEQHYANPMFGFQATGGSNSLRAFWKPLRQAGASARACFVEAAARSWSVRAEECRTESSTVIHDRTARKSTYGALVGQASAV
jgi:isoquinoline 1-oxidoreductase beta subunit